MCASHVYFTLDLGYLLTYLFHTPIAAVSRQADAMLPSAETRWLISLRHS